MNDIINKTIKEMPDDPWNLIGSFAFGLSNSIPSLDSLSFQQFIDGDSVLNVHINFNVRGALLTGPSTGLHVSEFDGYSPSEIQTALTSSKLSDVLRNDGKSVLYIPKIDLNLEKTIFSLLEESENKFQVASYLSRSVLSLILSSLPAVLQDKIQTVFQRIAHTAGISAPSTPLESRRDLAEWYGLPVDGNFLSKPIMSSINSKPSSPDMSTSGGKSPPRAKLQSIPPAASVEKIDEELKSLPQERDLSFWPYLSYPLLSLAPLVESAFGLKSELVKSKEFFDDNSCISILIPTEMNARLIEVASEQLANEEAELATASGTAASGKKASAPKAAPAKAKGNIASPSEMDTALPFKVPAVSSSIVSLQNSLLVGRRIRKEIENIFATDPKRFSALLPPSTGALALCPDTMFESVQVATKAITQVLGSSPWGGIPCDTVLLGGGLQINIYLPTINDDPSVATDSTVESLCNSLLNSISDAITGGIPMITPVAKAKIPEPPKPIPEAESSVRCVLIDAQNHDGKILKCFTGSEQHSKNLKEILNVKGKSVGLAVHATFEKLQTIVKPESSWLMCDSEEYIPQILNTAKVCFFFKCIYLLLLVDMRRISCFNNAATSLGCIC